MVDARRPQADRAPEGPRDFQPRVLALLASVGRVAWQFVGIAVALWIVGQVYVQLTEVLLAVFVAFVVAAATVPLAQFLERSGLNRGLAAGLAVLALVSALGGAFWGMAVRVTLQADDLAADVRGARDPLLDWLEDSPLQLSREEVAAVLQRSVEGISRDAGSDGQSAEEAGDAAAEAVVGEETAEAVEEDADPAEDSGADEPDEEALPDDQQGPAPDVAVRLIREGLGFARLGGFLLLGFVLSFFLLRDRDAIADGVVTHLVGGRHDDVAYEVLRRAWRALYGYVRASLLVGAVDAALIGVALFLVGVPLAGVLTLLTFLAAFVPVVGAVSVGVVSVGVALVSGGVGDAAIVAAVVVLVQQLDGNVLQPVLMRIGTGLHPTATILALVVGGVLGGVLGALLAVPVTAVLVAVAAALIESGVGQPDEVVSVQHTGDA